MFPPKIVDFVRNLITETERGSLSWSYDDELAEVRAKNNAFTISMQYTFNQLLEVGQFTLYYYSVDENKEYRFHTTQEYNDYDLARRLYDTAQSSCMTLPF